MTFHSTSILFTFKIELSQSILSNNQNDWSKKTKPSKLERVVKIEKSIKENLYCAGNSSKPAYNRKIPKVY